MDLKQNIKVSIGILVLKDNRILFGLTKDKKYILPVGHLEYMESFEKCAKREISEECGIKIKNIKLQFVSNTDRYTPKHYVHIGLQAEWSSGEPKVLEPGGITEWKWIPVDNVPDNLSPGAGLTIKAFREGKDMYDFDNK